jgi:cell division protein ZapE
MYIYVSISNRPHRFIHHWFVSIYTFSSLIFLFFFFSPSPFLFSSSLLISWSSSSFLHLSSSSFSSYRVLTISGQDVLERHFEIINLSSATDYRLIGAEGPFKVYHLAVDDTVATTLQAEVAKLFLGCCCRSPCDQFHRLTHGEAIASNPLLKVPGLEHGLVVPHSARGVCFFSFDHLCRNALSAADYLALAHAFHTVFVSDIPCLTLHEKDAARRFILFIDSLYEHRVKLVCSAHATPDKLFPLDTEGAAREEVFAFRRTASRLVEMSSAAYLSLPHKK